MVDLAAQEFDKLMRLGTLDATSGVDKYRASSKKASLVLSLRDIFARTSLASQWDTRILSAKIANNWATLIGMSSSQDVTMVGVENGVLTVTVKNPTWRANVLLYKQAIIDKINAYLEVDYILDIAVANGVPAKRRPYIPRKKK